MIWWRLEIACQLTTTKHVGWPVLACQNKANEIDRMMASKLGYAETQKHRGEHLDEG